MTTGYSGPRGEPESCVLVERGESKSHLPLGPPLSNSHSDRPDLCVLQSTGLVTSLPETATTVGDPYKSFLTGTSLRVCMDPRRPRSRVRVSPFRLESPLRHRPFLTSSNSELRIYLREGIVNHSHHRGRTEGEFNRRR